MRDSRIKREDMLAGSDLVKKARSLIILPTWEERLAARVSSDFSG